ncbi:MAG: C40 family peptidase [Treponema sp.]|nr:C40 family peptidase [Treponema sp.]
MKKTPIFLIILFFLVILVPQVCAQSKTVTAEEAAVMRKTFVEYSKRYIGKPYVRGATGPDSFDCSGLVFACSRESIGVQLPRQTRAMYAYCTIIDDAKREIGDLVFFKTTGDGSVSHVGIYAGNGQFINAASDGPNNGVILSSLKENYWKNHYFQTGRFLPSAAGASDSSVSDKKAETSGQNSANSAEQSSASTDSKSSSHGFAGFARKIIFDATLNLDWNFYTASSFKMNARGFSTMLHAMYDSPLIRPGFGTMIRYDAGTGTLQLPFIASLTIGEYFRIFVGPVFSIGKAKLPGDEDTRIDESIFPGIIGMCWQTPSFAAGKTRISFQQDIHYSVFNKTNGSALSLKDSLVSGLVFSTGVRVTLPMANIL